MFHWWNVIGHQCNVGHMNAAVLCQRLSSQESALGHIVCVFSPQATRQQLNVNVMMGISDAVLEDVRSPMTCTRLQYTMEQCFRKVKMAIKVYVCLDRSDIVSYTHLTLPTNREV